MWWENVIPVHAVNLLVSIIAAANNWAPSWENLSSVICSQVRLKPVLSLTGCSVAWLLYFISVANKNGADQTVQIQMYRASFLSSILLIKHFRKYLSCLMTKPTKWSVRPAKTRHQTRHQKLGSDWADHFVGFVVARLICALNFQFSLQWKQKSSENRNGMTYLWIDTKSFHLWKYHFFSFEICIDFTVKYKISIIHCDIQRHLK